MSLSPIGTFHELYSTVLFMSSKACTVYYTSLSNSASTVGDFSMQKHLFSGAGNKMIVYYFIDATKIKNNK